MVIPAAEGSDQLLLANNPEWRYVAGFHSLLMEAFRSTQHAEYQMRMHVSSTSNACPPNVPLKFHCPSVCTPSRARQMQTSSYVH